MRKLLIADDMEIDREILREIFRDQYEVLEAADGRSAIHILEEAEQELKLVLLDLVMPKKTGLEVLSYMKKRELLKDIPVIMITGEATVESDLKAYECGACDVIYKPFSRNMIRRRAENIVKLYESRRAMEKALASSFLEFEKIENGSYGEVTDQLLESLTRVKSEITEAMNAIREQA